MISARIRGLKGAISEGLTTTVQPAASAGAILCTRISKGTFHGVIKPHTPMGSAHDERAAHRALEIV